MNRLYPAETTRATAALTRNLLPLVAAASFGLVLASCSSPAPSVEVGSVSQAWTSEGHHFYLAPGDYQLVELSSGPPATANGAPGPVLPADQQTMCVLNGITQTRLSNTEIMVRLLKMPNGHWGVEARNPVPPFPSPDAGPLQFAVSCIKLSSFNADPSKTTIEYFQTTAEGKNSVQPMKRNRSNTSFHCYWGGFSGDLSATYREAYNQSSVSVSPNIQGFILTAETLSASSALTSYGHCIETDEDFKRPMSYVPDESLTWLGTGVPYILDKDGTELATHACFAAGLRTSRGMGAWLYVGVTTETGKWGAYTSNDPGIFNCVKLSEGAAP